MRGLFHSMRLFWLLGLILLVGSAFGAGWVINRSSANGVPTKPEKEGPLPFSGKFIVAFGYVDVDPGVNKGLYPLMPGELIWIAAEGTEVKKGADLLRVKDNLAQSDLKKAAIALADAKELESQAEHLRDKYKLSLNAQQSAINAALADKEAAESQVAKVKNLKDKGIGGSEFDLKAAMAVVKKAEAQIQAEKDKLEVLKEFGPEDKIKRAKLDVELKEQIVAHAKLALQNYVVKAPCDGTVLRTWASVGETLGPNPKVPALEFCPKLPRIVRAEIMQEYADRIKVGQDAIIQDDSSNGHEWKGKVVSISDWFTHRRSIIQEPFQFNDVRTLECKIEVTGQSQGPPLKIGQRMRVYINQGGP